MSTKEYDLSFKLQTFSPISPIHDSQNTNFNLNQNCENLNINFVQSKTISNKYGRIFNETKNYDLLERKNKVNWSKSEKLIESLNIYDSRTKEDQKKWKKNFEESDSTLSLHISAYENCIEADGNISNDTNLAVEKLNTKIVKQIFVQSPSTPTSVFEIPRQQDDNDASKTPEIMQFKASQKLLNPNNPGTAKAKATNEKETNAPEPATTTSAWSWIPSFFSSIFISKPPEKTMNESLSPIQQESPESTTSTIPKTTSINENHEKVASESQTKGLPELSLNATTISPALLQQQQQQHEQLDADEKCSRGHGDASPQSSDEGSAKNKSKELISVEHNKKFDDTGIILPKNSEAATMISVNLEEGHTSDSLLKELIPQPEILHHKPDSNPLSPKLKDIFELDTSTTLPGAVSTEPAFRPKCSFNRVSFSKSHTVYFLPNTKQKLHKKVVRSRHDAWRRYGALMVIHKKGGWSYTMNGKAKNFHKVEKDTPLPPTPVLPPILTEEEFHKRPIITGPTNSKSKRQRQQEKKESKGDTDTSVSDEDPPSC